MKKTLLFACVLLLSLKSVAQVTIGMSQVAPPIDGDTVAPGYVNNYTVWVKNTSPASAFNDYLSIKTAVRDSMASGGLDTVNLFSSVLPISIAAGDSAMFTLTDTLNISPMGYRYGIDVIVVWPVAASAITSIDSLEYSFYIMDGAGIGELDINQLLQLYPNPATDHFSIENKGTASIEKVNVYDLSGKLILSFIGENCVNVSVLKPGMYSVQVTLSDKTQQNIKLIKPKNSSE